MQIERQIGQVPRTTDIGLPLLSGAATVLNEKGMLIEINISPGGKIKEPVGMPSFFFNRYCAEHASNVKEIENLIKDKQPLGAYHLTATDGINTQSFHFYQNKDVAGKHVIESLKMDKTEPQVMVVANNAIDHKRRELINYCDSNLFELKKLLLEAARLTLVNNCESVLCAMYIYQNKNLIDAIVATDNLYAQNKELSEFNRLQF